MRVYLAARYSRRLELCGYRDELSKMGYLVDARWLNGKHQLDDVGKPIGDDGEALVEGGDASGAAKLRARFALDDYEDVAAAEIVINFTEKPRSAANRGGRHVEFGIALVTKARLIVVGPRENVFHWLPQVAQFDTWEEAKAFLERVYD